MRGFRKPCACCRRSPKAIPRCCCSANRARARRSSPGPSTSFRGAARARLWRSTAGRCPSSSWSRSFSVTNPGPLPTRAKTSPAGSPWPRVGRCCSTRSGTCRIPCSPRSCACSRNEASNRWAAWTACLPTCGWWRPPTTIWNAW